MRSLLHRSSVLLSLVALVLVPACASGGKPASGLDLGPATPPREWTQAFLREAVLVADEIAIEGPVGLVEHVALRQDEESTVYTTKTLPEGFFQELLTRPQSGVEVRAQLDGWALAALRKITVLERPGPVPVTIRARGSAYWAAADGSDERRQPELVFQGKLGG